MVTVTDVRNTGIRFTQRTWEVKAVVEYAIGLIPEVSTPHQEPYTCLITETWGWGGIGFAERKLTVVEEFSDNVKQYWSLQNDLYRTVWRTIDNRAEGLWYRRIRSIIRWAIFIAILVAMAIAFKLVFGQ